MDGVAALSLAKTHLCNMYKYHSREREDTCMVAPSRLPRKMYTIPRLITINAGPIHLNFPHYKRRARFSLAHAAISWVCVDVNKRQRMLAPTPINSLPNNNSLLFGWIIYCFHGIVCLTSERKQEWGSCVSYFSYRIGKTRNPSGLFPATFPLDIFLVYTEYE